MMIKLNILFPAGLFRDINTKLCSVKLQEGLMHDVFSRLYTLFKNNSLDHCSMGKYFGKHCFIVIFTIC